MRRRAFLTALLVMAAIGVGSGAPQRGGGRGGPPIDPDAVTPVEFVIEPPTLINLGFEWFIQGDDNRNAPSRFPTAGRETTSGNRRCPCCA